MLKEDDLKENFVSICYNGMKIETELQCMEKLSQGLSIEESYRPFGSQELPSIFITTSIAHFYLRGQEFLDYSNQLVEETTKPKKKSRISKKKERKK